MNAKLLQPGITGFAPSHGAAFPNAVELKTWKGDIYDAARTMGLRVVDVQAASVTPNFHSAALVAKDRALFVLCNASFPVVAIVAERPKPGRLLFLNNEQIASAFKRKGTYLVADATELARRLTSADVNALDPVEQKQIAYWRPQTVGEVVFNWFD
jgi:hypothetical protein